MNCLVTIAGTDKPGITAALSQVLVEESVALLDIEQVVVQGQLTLCLFVELESESLLGQKVLQKLRERAEQLGQVLSYRTIQIEPKAMNRRRYALTLISDSIGVHSVQKVAEQLASYQANIEQIKRLSQTQLSSLEVAISIDESQVSNLKRDLLSELSQDLVDIALQPESLLRRNKRLIVLDMDSTLIQAEVIDEIARMHGVYESVSRITAQAMHEGLDFKESLERRVALLTGFDVQQLNELVLHLPLTEGAETLVRVLKSLGYQIGIISGGFEQATSYFKEKLGLDFAYANRLEDLDGKLTGRVIPPIVDASRKADLLEAIAQARQIPLEQTIAIGDGANDALMLAKAGLGIAYHAKPLLKNAADTAISSGGLERILYLLGIRADEIKDYL